MRKSFTLVAALAVTLAGATVAEADDYTVTATDGSVVIINTAPGYDPDYQQQPVYVPPPQPVYYCESMVGYSYDFTGYANGTCRYWEGPFVIFGLIAQEY